MTEPGGLHIDSEKVPTTMPSPLVELTLYVVPAAAATLERGRLAESSLSVARRVPPTEPRVFDACHSLD